MTLQSLARFLTIFPTKISQEPALGNQAQQEGVHCHPDY